MNAPPQRSRFVVMRRPGEFSGVDFLTEQPAGEVYGSWDSRETFTSRRAAQKEEKTYGRHGVQETRVVTEAHGRRMWKKYQSRDFGLYGKKRLKVIPGVK